MQRGSLALVSRKEGPDVWQFRWSEKDLHGVRVQRKRVIGTVERYPAGAGARTGCVTNSFPVFTYRSHASLAKTALIAGVQASTTGGGFS